MALGLLGGALSVASKAFKAKKVQSGAKMASAIVKREPQKDAIAKEQPKVKTKVVSVSSLMNVKSLESRDIKQSKKSSGVESVDIVLNNIDNTLAGLIGTLKSSSQLYKKEIRRKNRRKERAKRSEKEKSLENKKPMRFGRVPVPFRSAFNSIKNFFSNIIIGSLVVLLLDNLNRIIKAVKETYNKLKQVVTKVGEFLQPVWKALKWIWPGNSPSGLEMVRSILGNKNTQDLMDPTKIKEVEDVYKQIEDQTKVLQGSFKDLELKKVNPQFL